ncbi:Cysteine desulfurase activator SufB [Halapricum desulfuricans]|uniref:Cysteine desulfurase activator SufB n=1 Tax=Halapricum desulfuricans TaxID=2841257 RepID=A0A897NK19_9EURY|nr:Cysteine desulfurase activator SufB [Halapricum desulfuricans]
MMQSTDTALTPDAVRAVSEAKDEPGWLLKLRLDALERFHELPMPEGWPGQPDLSALDLDGIVPYLRPDVDVTFDEGAREGLARTFDRLGIPETEREALAGDGAQVESEVLYHRLEQRWADEGVIFCSMDDAVHEHPDLVREYFTSAIAPDEHKFAALHYAFWSGGSFLYVPEGVSVTLPIHAYFRMNEPGTGQFSHNLIVAEPESEVHYIEGCSAPTYNASNLDCGAVEVIVGEDAHVQHSTIQNWSRNTYCLNTDRAIVEAGGRMEWISGMLGSKVTMLYPSSILRGRGASAKHLTVTCADDGQNLDSGAKIHHEAPGTTATIEAKSISRDGGRTNFRGLVRSFDDPEDVATSVECDALMFDNESTSDTMPHIEVIGDDATIAHEATVGKIGDEDVFYLQSRGLDEDDAKGLIVSGFLEPLSEELPVAYAAELNRLVALEMEGSLG